MRACVEREIEKTDEVATLFRSNSLSAKVLSLAARRDAVALATTLFAPFFEACAALEEPLEVDPRRLDDEVCG